MFSVKRDCTWMRGSGWLHMAGGTWQGLEGQGRLSQAEVGWEELPGGWLRGIRHRGPPESLATRVLCQMEDGRRGWGRRRVGSLVCQAESLALGSRVLLPDRHPAGFIPVSPTPLIPATQDLCHRNSLSPKAFLSLLVSHHLLHSGNFSSLCLLETFSSSFKIQLKCHLFYAAFSDCHDLHELLLPLESHNEELVLLLFSTH